MKMSKFILTCPLVTSGLLMCQPSQAVTTDGFGFHGYFRAGTLYSVQDDWKRAKFPAQKETLGRLGIESDNHYELALDKLFTLDDGQTITIKTRAGADNNETANNQLGSNVDSTDIGIMETFVEFGGITPTGKLWGGKRFYGKDNYIFMTDFFYTDWSGTGIGIEAYEAGGVKWDAAYIASDRSDDDAGRWGTNTNNTMHAGHLAANFGDFELHGVVKYLPDNTHTDGAVSSSDYANNGHEVTGIYTPENFFWLPGNGFSKLIVQGGQGLGAGRLLGGTITTYNAYKPGSLSTGGGLDNLTKVKSGDRSVRLLAWGGYFFEHGISIFPSLQAQYNDYEDGGNDYWASAMMQPSYRFTKNFFINSQIGYLHEEKNYSGETSDRNDTTKVTIAPTFNIDTGMGPSPELRFLATYLTDSGTNAGKEDVLFGIQADMWW